jgi:hypothetical protein
MKGLLLDFLEKGGINFIRMCRLYPNEVSLALAIGLVCACELYKDINTYSTHQPSVAPP